MSKLRMCPHCRAFVPSGERICTECHEPMGRPYISRFAVQGAAMAGLVPATHFTTLIILLLNAGLFAATLIMSNQEAGGQGSLWSVSGMVLYRFGAKEATSVFAGQWWRLVTAGFLHGGVLHILMNSWALYDLGAQVEDVYGTSRFLVFYLLTSISGFLASCFWTRAISIGASAALFGLIGAMIAYGYHNRGTHIGHMVKSVYARWAVYGLLFSLIPGIDIAAHVGGLAAGFVLGYVCGTPRHTPIEKLWNVAAGFCLIIVAASFYLAYATFSQG